MPRMKDVARHAGVSVATVSNVVTGKKAVSPASRDKVLSAINDLGYRVNTVARGLKMQRTYTIGVIFPDVTKLFFADVIRGIMDSAYKQGYSVNILSSGYRFEKEQKQVRRLRMARVDGVILDSCAPLEKTADWVRELVGNEEEAPVVSLESRLDAERISSVCIENRLYSGRVTQHLIDGGAKRIFFICGPRHLEHEAERLLGYRETLAKNGLPLADKLIAGGDYLSGTGYTAVCNALRDGVSFDAVQASNDQAAIGALKALREFGIDVPGRVALTGFDNLFASTLVTPAITTVNVPRYEMGCVAVTELFRVMADRDAYPSCHILPASIVVRSSSCPNLTDEWNLENW